MSMDARNGIGGSLAGLDLRAEIDRLRKERNAVILAHYYQKPELQDLADFVGDSLDLSRKAAETDADVIAFCGVRFMAETAKILSPDKIVVLPDMNAGCSLEDSCPPDQFAAFRAAHPDHIALTYINCSTEVKALSDIIVTSSSAEKILSQIPLDQKIIFGPDRNLGGYLTRVLKREMLLWPGVCIVHEAFSETELLKLRARHPGAPIAAHPECPPHILDHADYVGSTRGILDFAKSFAGDTLIVATEPHIIHQMEKARTATATAISARTWRSTTWRSSIWRSAISPRASRSRKACASRPRRASTGCWRWRAPPWGRATSARCG
jgi:quinolinate synthase